MLDVDIREKTFATAHGVSLPVIRDLAFRVETARFTCLVGPSGCGKTTTLRLILGLDRAFAGSIKLADGDGRVAAVFQEPCLLPWRSAEANVRLALPDSLKDSDLQLLFSALGLDGLERLFPGELSLGLARRVAIARAFAIEPSLLVLDEPFVSLDDPTASRLRSLLIDLWSARPTTVLMVTHNLAEAVELADEIVVLTARPTTVAGVVKLDTPRSQRDQAMNAEAVQAIQQSYQLASEPRVSAP